jgi:predicted RNase H-like HicB family nuclease
LEILVTVETNEETGQWVVACPVIPGLWVQGKGRDESFALAQSAIRRNLEKRAGRKLAVDFELRPFYVFGDRKDEKVWWTGEQERIDALIQAAQSAPATVEPVKECLGRFRSSSGQFLVRGGWAKMMARHRQGCRASQNGQPSEFERIRRG